MKFTVVIPARFAASRLPGKPLLDLNGKPMVQHVYERAQQSGAEKVYVATDDQRIHDAVEGFGGQVVMTDDKHRSGTDRVQEVAAQLALDDAAIVVNLQGDEPLIPPAAIKQVARNLADDPVAGMASLYEPIDEQADIDDPNVVKVVVDASGYALYFSRSTIPHGGSVESNNCLRHVGIYAYRVATLKRFVAWPPGKLEEQEKLEQLRALQQGVRIHMAPACEAVPGGIDTERDLQLVRKLLLEIGPAVS